MQCVREESANCKASRKHAWRAGELNLTAPLKAVLLLLNGPKTCEKTATGLGETEDERSKQPNSRRLHILNLQVALTEARLSGISNRAWHSLGTRRATADQELQGAPSRPHPALQACARPGPAPAPRRAGHLAVHVVLRLDELAPVHLARVRLTRHDVTLGLVEHFDRHANGHLGRKRALW